MHYGCRELYMTLSCRTVSDPGWRAGRSSHSHLFPFFVFCRQRKQCGKQDMENKRVVALMHSHQFRYCIYLLSLHDLLSIPLYIKHYILSRILLRLTQMM